MTPQDEQELLRFFEDCSDRSLEDFFLAKANQADLLRKDLNALIGRMVENAALLWLGDFLRRHRSRIREGFDEQLPSPPRAARPHAARRGLLEGAPRAAREHGAPKD